MMPLRTIVNKVKISKAQKFIYARVFDGMPKEDNFELVEEDIPPLKDGEYLAQAQFLSIDPYMRAYTYKLPIGSTMMGSQVAKIIDSKNPNFPVGKHVVGEFGWRTLTVADSKPGALMRRPPYLVPESEGMPLSLFLGILGMTGNSAYFGFMEICKPIAGDTVVISGAAGGVGSHVGQIAKIKGCKVIGLTGSDEKAQWLRSIGFNEVINYKTENLMTSLRELAPERIDSYFDNVGGEISSLVIQNMKKYGRVSVCGCISSYNLPYGSLPKATIIQPSIIMNELKVKGFLVSSWKNRWMEGINKNLEWLREGKLVYKETVTKGFENMPKALIGILSGDNIGKAVVKV
ncbi:prostaglandin reductase 1-like [Onthophagus taurus]|uniref:prostaglandin reductase 1-like n=1 Tax=Onthophagus taurus TaxID=166361 RepID=UPI000C20AC1D|nr:prostaglandin reductase 1-like [Onthophagus taurus]